MALNVLDNEALFNVLLLDGHVSPGKVTLNGHDRDIGWDVQAGPFQSGARIWFKWRPPVEFTATFELLRDVSQGIDDFATWDAFQQVIESSVANPRRPKALLIYHPDLTRNKIGSVVLKKLGGFVYDGKGGAKVSVRFLEYYPPRKQEGAPKAKAEVDPNAAMKKEVARLTAQYQATPWG